jgi:hypothetical protein
MADIEIKARISADTSEATKGVDKLNNSLGATKKSTTDSVGSFGNLKKTLSDISPAAEAATKGAGMLNGALNMLRANPIIAVISLIVIILVSLFEKFKKMEGVSDSLGKAWGVLSGVFSKFINGILTPLIDGFTKLVELFTNGVIAVLETLGLTSKETAERFGEITEALDDLEDSQKNAAIATAESNRKLQEAREIAGDANVPIKERIEALKLAGKIEKEELDKVVEVNRMKTALVLESIAMELGAKSSLIAKIKEGSLENLKAARLELANMKNVDKEKLYAIDQQIIAAENAAAQSAKIGKKTQSQIDSLNKEQAAKEKEAADKRKAQQDKEAAEYNKYLQLKNKLTNEANLAAIQDEVKLNIQKVLNQEKDKLKEIEALKTSEKNKAELVAMIKQSSLQEIAKIERDDRIKKAKIQADFDLELNKLHTESLLSGVKDARAKEQAALDLGFEEKFNQAKEKYKNDAIKLQQVQEELATQQRNAQSALDDKFEKEDKEKKKKKDEEQGALKTELLNPYDKEVAQLEEAYKKKLEIAKGNEALIAAVQKEYAEQTTALKAKHLNDQLNETKSVGDNIASVIGQQTAVGKGLGIANALINTYQGATDALRAKSTLPSPFDVIAKVANVAAVLASGFKAVKAITSVQVPGAAGGGGATPSVPTPITPQQISTQLNASSIQGVGNAAGAGAGRSFVLDTDIKDNQERQARINRAARLG